MRLVHTTICALAICCVRDGARRHAGGDGGAESAARILLERRSCSGRLSTNDVIDPVRTQSCALPPLWHRDVLRALDYLRTAGEPDAREEAVATCSSACDSGQWLPDVGIATPHTRNGWSRRRTESLITLRARRVLGLVRRRPSSMSATDPLQTDGYCILRGHPARLSSMPAATRFGLRSRDISTTTATNQTAAPIGTFSPAVYSAVLRADSSSTPRFSCVVQHAQDRIVADHGM